MDQVGHGAASEERLDLRIARLVAPQHGVFSRSQALELGASRGLIDWRVRTSIWEVVYPGIYRVAGVPASWRQRLMAACLVAGEGAAASHRSAGLLKALPGMPEGIVELSVPNSRRMRRSGLFVHQTGVLPPIDLTIVDGIPTTNVTRTMIDLAAVISKDILEEALDDALRRGLTSVRRLRWRLDEMKTRGRPGMKAFGALLDARASSDRIPKSVLETRALRLIRRKGLPVPECQYPITSDGRVIAVVDFAYPERKIAIEVEGRAWHSSRARWNRDLSRRNALTALGWRVIHIAWIDLRDYPDRTVKLIADVLAG